MDRRLIAAATALVAAVALAGVSAAATSSPGTGAKAAKTKGPRTQQQNGGVISQPAAGDPRAYWTKERMDAAQSRDMGVPTSGGGSTGSSGSGAGSPGDRIVVTSP